MKDKETEYYLPNDEISVENLFGPELNDVDKVIYHRFLIRLHGQPDEKIKLLSSYARQFGVDFITAHYNYGNSEESTNLLTALCEKFETDQTRTILNKYADLVHSAQAIKGCFKSNKRELSNDPKVRNEVMDSILNKGNKLLNYMVTDMDPKEYYKFHTYLNGYNAELLIILTTLKSLRSEGLQVKIEQLKDLQAEKIDGNDFVTNYFGTVRRMDDRIALTRILDSNWQDQGAEGQKVISDFEELFYIQQRKGSTTFDEAKMRKNTFYIVRRKLSRSEEKVDFNAGILAFFRIEEMPDGSLYLGSVNSDKSIAGYQIGEALLENYIPAIGADKRIVADCNPQSPITNKYIGKYGFIITQITDYAEPNDTFAIERDDSATSPYKGRRFEFQGKDYQTLLGLIPQYKDNPDAELRTYTFPQEYDIFTTEVKAGLSGGNMVGTAFARSKPDATGSYQVIIGLERVGEPVKPGLEQQVTEPVDESLHATT